MTERLRSRGGLSLAAWVAAAVIVPVTAAAAVSWQSVYTAPYATTPTSPLGGWTASQAPTGWTPTTGTAPTTPSGISTRLDIESTPGTTPVETSPYVLRAEVQRGDKTVTGTVTKARAEVQSNAPGAKGIDGTQVFYGFSLRLHPNWKTGSGSTRWTVLTQWKGDNSLHEPPLELVADGGNLILTRQVEPDPGPTNDPNKFTCTGSFCNLNLGPLPIGTWTRLVVGVNWSTKAGASADGYVCVKRNSQRVDFGQSGNSYCTTNVQTLQKNSNGSADNTYLKQGIYQSSGWDSELVPINHVAWFSPVKVSATALDVGGW